MNLPILFAAEVLTEGSPVSITLAVLVGGSVVTLAVGLAESRFKISAQDKQIQSLRADLDRTDEKAAKALEDNKRDAEKDRNEIRAKVQIMEVSRAEDKVLVAEVRTRLTQMDEQNREQTRLLHELVAITSGNARRRSSDAA